MESILVDSDGIADENKLIRRKGKSESVVSRKEIFVELKPRSRTGKCFGAAVITELSLAMSTATKAEVPKHYVIISSDIWFHVSKHIAPENVQTFAQICSETAALTKTRRFWNHLYLKYCQKGRVATNWILGLPMHLQYSDIKHCDTRTFRCNVIESLFFCYTPLKKRLQHGYELDALVGHTYISSWHKQLQCSWITCYKFQRYRSSFATRTAQDAHELCSIPQQNVNDWESLAKDITFEHQRAYPLAAKTHEGTSLLVIVSDRFTPFLSQLSYGATESHIRLEATRQLLTTDLRGSNLELDFVDGSKLITTAKYPDIKSWKVLPWWHPDYKKFVK